MDTLLNYFRGFRGYFLMLFLEPRNPQKDTESIVVFGPATWIPAKRNLRDAEVGQ